MTMSTYRAAFDHTEAVLEELSKPQPDWRRIRAHADALSRLARDESREEVDHG
jgi:hypothetical protein